MSLPVQTYDQIVMQQQSAMQATASVPLDFSAGSILGAIVASNAGNFLWLQALATSLQAITRLSTCQGSDCDTFCADFDFYRYIGNQSNGNVTFSRITATSIASIPVGSIISVSITNNLTFMVILDTTNPNYNPVTNSYTVAVGISSISLPVICQLAGSIGNVLIGQINTINSIIPGIDFVTNPLAFTNGADPWSDAIFKQQFALYIQSLTRATGPAINFAISTTNAGVSNAPQVKRYIAIENLSTDGITQRLGFFYAVVDDGTGITNPALIANVAQNLEQYRGLTIAYDVLGPTQLVANINLAVKVIANQTNTNAQIILNIKNALQAFISTLNFNKTFYFSRIAQIAYDADPNVLDVFNVSLNSGSADLVAFNTQLIFPGTINVTVTT